jgi:hypothetical protein
VLADLIVAHLVPAGAALTVAIDDTLFHRAGRKAHAASWCHDGSAKGPRKIACGEQLGHRRTRRHPAMHDPPGMPARAAPPVEPNGATKLVLARQLIDTLAGRWPDRRIHVVADAAYAASELAGLPARVSATSRLRRNAVLYDLAPPRWASRKWGF